MAECQDVVYLLYNVQFVYNTSTTNWSNRVWAYAFFYTDT